MKISPVDTGKDLFQLALKVQNKHPKLYLRLLMVYFVVSLGYSRCAAAHRLGTTDKTVGKWVRRYQEEGENGLLDRSRSGSPRKFGDAERELVVRVAQADPAEITDHLTNWSLQTIRRYLLMVYTIDMSTSTISRILHEHDICFRTVEETIVSPDPEYEIKKQIIEDAKEEAKHDPEVAFLSLDEKGPIHALFHRGGMWMRKDTRQLIPRNHNKSNGKVVLNAAFEVATNKLWWYFSEKRTGEAFLMLLMELSLDPILQTMKKVYLLMDNLPAHFTRNIKEFLALHPQFEVLRLPTYSPELNPIERVFGDLDRQAIQNHHFKDTEELEWRIEAWLLDRMVQPVKPIDPVSPRKTRRRFAKRIMSWK